MYVIKMKTVIAYIAACAILISAIGICQALSSGSAAASGDKSVALPIIMYHSIVDNAEKAGKFVITPTELEADLKYLTQSGYETVFMSEVISYVESGTPLPEKPIVLTFDDGYYNNYCYLFPLLKKYNLKAVISIVGSFTDLYTQEADQNPEYAHLSWDNVNEMMDSGLVEFQNHSYNMHSIDKGRNGSKKKSGESAAEYKAALSDDLTLLQNEFIEHTGYTPLVYTYPFGSVSEASFEIIKKLGFKASLSCENKTNYIKQGDKDGLYMLNRFIRTAGAPLCDILKGL